MWINSCVLMLNVPVALEDYYFLLSDEKVDNLRGVTFCWIKKEYGKYFMTVKGLLASKGSFICITLFCFYVPDCDDSQVLHMYSVSKQAQCHHKIGISSLTQKSLGFISWQLSRHELYISVSKRLDISSVVEKLFSSGFVRSVGEKLFLVAKFFFCGSSCKYFLVVWFWGSMWIFSEALCDHRQGKITGWSQNNIFDV